MRPISLCLFMALAAVGQVATLRSAIAAPISHQAAHANFKTFFEDFRKAVLADDREAVASMVEFPFTDYRVGYYCEHGQSDCSAPANSLTSPDKATFLVKYRLIFTPTVINGIRDRKIRAHGVDDDGDAPGPIKAGEYLLDLSDSEAQRVFSKTRGVYKMVRVPFYS